MALLNVCWILVALSLQNIFTEAKPNFFDDAIEPYGGGSPSGGGLVYGSGPSGLGGFGGFGDGGYAPLAPSPHIPFLPVPQPLPIRVPISPKQSVTIPNIILALLPPNQKPASPRPIVRPPHALPLPRPYPLPIQSGYGAPNYGFGGC